jgi:hypothetical protein
MGFSRIILKEDRSLSAAETHEVICAEVERRFHQKGTCMPPLWILATETSLIWLETAWESDSEKYGMANRLRTLLKLSNCKHYAFACEVWVAMVRENDPDAAVYAENGEVPAHLMPRNRPDREDKVMIVTQARDGAALTTDYLVTERHGIGPNFLGPRVDEVHGFSKGAMWNLFE